VALTPEGVSPSQILIAPGAAKRTARNAAALILSAILTKGLLFLWQIYLARSLGVGEYGVYGTISALMIIGATIPDFGMGLIVTRDVANRPGDAGRYLALTLIAQPLLAIGGYIALMLAAAFLGYDAGLRVLLALAAVSLMVDTLGNMVYNQLIAFERMVITAILSIGHTAVLILLGAIALAAKGGLWGLYAAIVAAGSLRAIAHWLALLHTGVRPVFPVTRTLARYMLVNGAPFALTAFLSLAYIHSDKLLATALIGTEGTGQLMASFVIVFGVMELLGTPMLVTVLPLMSRLQGPENREKLNFMLEKLAFFTLILSLPIAVLTALLAGPLSGLVYGSNFLGSAAVLRIMIWYAVAAMLANVFSQALVVQNRQRRLSALRVGGLALSIAMNLILLPRLGISGTPIAMLTTELVVLAFLLLSLELPADWWRRMIAYAWRLGIAASGLAIVTFLLRAVHPVLAVLLGLPIFAGLLLLSGAITTGDRALAYQLLAAAPGGTRFLEFCKRLGIPGNSV
jgi:O-antigen/teichoic acid export membrane protein